MFGFRNEFQTESAYMENSTVLFFLAVRWGCPYFYSTTPSRALTNFKYFALHEEGQEDLSDTVLNVIEPSNAPRFLITGYIVSQRLIYTDF